MQIARQPLTQALKELAQITRTQLLFRESDIGTRQSARLSGRHSPEKALNILLRGSGLIARRVADRTFIVEPAPQRAAPQQVAKRARARAAAAAATPAAVAEPATEPILADILVTARRYSESLQSTPIAVSQFSGRDLSDAGANSIRDLDGMASGLSIIEGNGGVASMFVRGVGHDDSLLSTDPGVGVYLDGVYLGRLFGNAIDMIDTSQIEVLRGPQGTLYGRNSEAGTINIHSALPRQSVGATSEIMLGSRDRTEMTGMINLPVTENSAMRLAVSSRRQGGYIKNLQGGPDGGDVDRQSARISYLNDLPSGIRFHFSADYYRQREHGRHYNLVAIAAVSDPNQPTPSKLEFWNRVVAPATGQAPLDKRYLSPPRTMHSTEGLQSDVDHWGLNLTLEGDIGSAQWKSISALRRVSARWGNDYDRSPASIWIASIPSARQTQLSEEIQLSGTLGSSVKYTGGLFFFREQADDHHLSGLPIGAMDVLARAAPHSIAAPGYAGLSCPNSDPVINLAHCIGGAPDIAPEAHAQALALQLSVPIFSYRGASGTNASAYTHVSYAPTDRVELSGGIRLGYEAKSATYYDFTPTAQTERRGERSLSWVVPTWSMTLAYRPTDDQLFYAGWSRGYKAGGVNLRPLQGELRLDGYDPETNTNLELGFKSQWWDDRVRLNLAAYFQEYSGFQDADYKVVNGLLVSRLNNRADADAYGFEADFSAALTTSLSLKGSLGHQAWKYVRVTQEGSDALRLGQNRPLLLPSTTLRSALKWEKALPIGTMMAMIDLRWRSSVLLFYGVANAGGVGARVTEVREPPSMEVNLSASYKPPSSNLEFRLFVNNLFNRAYRLNYFNAGVSAELWNAPREWRAGLRYSF